MRVVLASLLLLALAAAAPAAVIHVPGDQPAIRMGITAAADGDTVLVAAGVWSGSLNRNLDLYGKAITVLGAGPGQSVIDCGGAAKAFLMLGGETPATVIEGFSIVNGFGNYGGAIEIDAAAATLRDLSIEDCSATKGGGISIRFAVGTVLVENVVLARGTASSGGGAYSYFSDVDYRGVTAVGNAATAYSAAFHVSTGNVTFTRCLIAWNEDLPAVNGTFAAEDFVCCDFYNNEAGDLAQTWLVVIGVNGNFAADPLFCDRTGGDYGLHAASPCLAANDPCGERIGARGEACDYALAILSGRTETALGMAIGEVPLVYDGGSTHSDAQGNYAIYLLPGWSGSVTPSHDYYDFLPPSRSYANLQTGLAGQDFIGAHKTLIRVPADLPSLQAAIVAAAEGDTVLVAPGTYAGTANTNLDFAGKNIVLISEAGAETTIIAGDQGGDFGLAFGADNGAATVVDGFTLRGFEAYDGAGTEGALTCRPGSAPTLRGLKVVDNLSHINGISYTFGSGLRSWGASPTIVDCSFAGNTARAGGAVWISGGAPRFVDVRFEGNRANGGGAVSGSSSGARFEHCTFAQNEAVPNGDFYGCEQGVGGAAYAEGLTFVDCLFVENRVDSCRDANGHPMAVPGAGGALYVSDAVSIERCTFVGNAAEADAATPPPGAAIHIVDGSATITASIIAGANAGATALYCAPGTGTASVSCSVFWDNPGGNTGGDCADPVGSNGNFAADPRFCDDAAGDFSLDADSPCLPAHNDCGLIIGAFGQSCGATAAETPPVVGFALGSHPNPFNPSTTLRFTLTAPSAVTLTVHDLAGRRVATLLDGQRCEAGPQSVAWDGRLAAGGRAASGVYLVRLAAAGREEAHKIALLK